MSTPDAAPVEVEGDGFARFFAGLSTADLALLNAAANALATPSTPGAGQADEAVWRRQQDAEDRLHDHGFEDEQVWRCHARRGSSVGRCFGPMAAPAPGHGECRFEPATGQGEPS